MSKLGLFKKQVKIEVPDTNETVDGSADAEASPKPDETVNLVGNPDGIPESAILRLTPNDYNYDLFKNVFREDATKECLFNIRRKNTITYPLPLSDKYREACLHLGGAMPIMETFLYKNMLIMEETDRHFEFPQNRKLFSNYLAARIWVFTLGFHDWIKAAEETSGKSRFNHNKNKLSPDDILVSA